MIHNCNIIWNFVIKLDNINFPFGYFSSINCDINVNNTIALRNTVLIRTYVDLDPRIKPLLMVIKYWAKRRALNDGMIIIVTKYFLIN